MLAQFLYNSSIIEITFVTLFYANFDYESMAYREFGISNINNELARVTVDKIKDLYYMLFKEFKFVIERNAYYYNKRYSQESILKEGDKVYLIRKNINIK